MSSKNIISIDEHMLFTQRLKLCVDYLKILKPGSKDTDGIIRIDFPSEGLGYSIHYYDVRLNSELLHCRIPLLWNLFEPKNTLFAFAISREDQENWTYLLEKVSVFQPAWGAIGNVHPSDFPAHWGSEFNIRGMDGFLALGELCLAALKPREISFEIDEAAVEDFVTRLANGQVMTLKKLQRQQLTTSLNTPVNPNGAPAP